MAYYSKWSFDCMLGSYQDNVDLKYYNTDSLIDLFKCVCMNYPNTRLCWSVNSQKPLRYQSDEI
jgi:hypothetical protein